jgi:hypothetical protein
MNTIDAIMAIEAGQSIPIDTPVKVKGYLPCKLATGKPAKNNREVCVVFGGGKRMFFPATMILFGEEDIKRGFAKA